MGRTDWVLVGFDYNKLEELKLLGKETEEKIRGGMGIVLAGYRDSLYKC